MSFSIMPREVMIDSSVLIDVSLVEMPLTTASMSTTLRSSASITRRAVDAYFGTAMLRT